MDNYLDFGVPISFGWTAGYLDTKTQTRRQWKDSHAAKFLKAYDRAAVEGKHLRVPAIDKGYHAGGRQIGWCRLLRRPYKEPLNRMGYTDLLGEGGMCATAEEFIQKYFGGNAELEVWVIDFIFTPLPDCNLEFVPVAYRPFYVAARARMTEDVEAGYCDENGGKAIPQIKSSICRRQNPKIRNRLFEADPEYDDLDFDRDLAIKRYLRLIGFPTYYADPPIEVEERRGRPPKAKDSQSEDEPLPPHLITTGCRVVPALRKKILGAVAIHSHCLGIKQKINIRTLFYETKLFGYRYNYKSQQWECG